MFIIHLQILLYPWTRYVEHYCYFYRCTPGARFYYARNISHTLATWRTCTTPVPGPWCVTIIIRKIHPLSLHVPCAHPVHTPIINRPLLFWCIALRTAWRMSCVTFNWGARPPLRHPLDHSNHCVCLNILYVVHSYRIDEMNIHVYAHTCIFVCVCVYIYIYAVCVRMHVYIYILLYLCVCAREHTPFSLSSPLYLSESRSKQACKCYTRLAL